MKWEAEYTDGTILTEDSNLFGDIDQAQLKEFRLKEGNATYSVSLSNGKFNLNGQIINGITGDRELLYARRNVVSVKGSGAIGGRIIKYLLGYKTATNEKVCEIVNNEANMLSEPSGVNPL